jgi:hypothetical protein
VAVNQLFYFFSKHIGESFPTQLTSNVYNFIHVLVDKRESNEVIDALRQQFLPSCTDSLRLDFIHWLLNVRDAVGGAMILPALHNVEVRVIIHSSAGKGNGATSVLGLEGPYHTLVERLNQGGSVGW